MDSDIPLRASGELRTTPLVQLLWDLSRRSFTGTLVLRVADGQGLVSGESAFSFEAGLVSQAQLPTACDTLGRVLVDAGVISLEQLDLSLERVQRGEGLQGSILVSMGACDAIQVERALREQLRRKLHRHFPVVDARWELHADIDLLEGYGGRRFPVPVEPMLWEGLRANPEHPLVDAVLERLGTRRLRFVTGSPAPTLFASGDLERRLVDRFLTGARVQELLDEGLSPMRVRAFVCLLAVTRQLERVASAQLAPQPSLFRAPAPSMPPGPVAPTPSIPPLRAPSIPPDATPTHVTTLPVLTAAPANDSPVDPAAARRLELVRVEHALQRSCPIEAEHLARALVTRDARDVDALVLLAQALLDQDVPGYADEVRQRLAEALTIAPDNDRAFTVAARMYRRTGDARRALACFAKAYRLNPRNVEAVRELRLATMRRGGSGVSSGGLLTLLVQAR